MSAVNPMNTMGSLNESVQLLHQKLLDLAIRGKLTDQRPDEKLSEEILSLPEVEGPFEIPSNWKWISNDLVIVSRKTLAPEQMKESVLLWTIPAYDAGLPERTSRNEIKSGKKIVKKDDVLLSKIVPQIIRVWHVTTDEECQVGSTEWVTFRHNNILPQYLCLVLRSYWFHELVMSTVAGVGGSLLRANPKKLKAFSIPVPPLAEQHRIVSVMTDADVMIRSLSSHQKVLQEKIETTQAKVLDLAIHGCLVEQRPEEKLSEEVLSLPEIEGPFEIPDNWKWVTLGSALNYGNVSNAESEDIPDNGWILELEDIEKNTGRILKREYKKPGMKLSTKRQFSKGMVLYSKLRPYLNKVVLADDDGYCTSEIVPINVKDAPVELDARFVVYWLRSPWFVAKTNSLSYGVKMPRLGTKDAKQLPIPVPPLAEQYRICEAIEALQDKCSKLTALLK